MTSEAMAGILQPGSSIALPDSEHIGERRATATSALSGPLADGTVAEEAPVGGRPALWIRPSGRDNAPGSRVVLYLHGGAFEVGSPAAYQAFCSGLSLRLGATVVIPDYRLAPENAFPAAVDDVAAAYVDLLDRGHAASSIALIGDSAGGVLVLSCLLAAQRGGLPQPAAAAGLSSWADLTLEADSHTRCAATDAFISTDMLRRAAGHYLVDADPRDPLASPVFADREELGSLAPTLLQAAANEVLADDSATMAKKIDVAGGDVTLELCPEAFHVWHIAGDGIPEASQALAQLAKFVCDRWGQR